MRCPYCPWYECPNLNRGKGCDPECRREVLEIRISEGIDWDEEEHTAIEDDIR
jgi:hypothetical protein